MKHLRLASAAGLAVLAAALALPAVAQFQKPGDAIKYRQSAMTLMGTHMGRLGAMAQGKVPFDAKAMAANAAVLITVAPLPFTAFGEGTDKGAPTRADEAIWKEQAKFREYADQLQTAVAGLDKAARSGDETAMKSATGEVGKVCKGCHDDYQLEKAVTR